jgi:xylulokinase
MALVLGIDLGLTGARAVLVDRHGGLLASGRSPLPAPRVRSASVHDWRAAVASAVRSALAGTEQPVIEAIGIGALGPCPVLLDEHLHPLGNVPLFSRDNAAETERQAMLVRHGLADEQLGPDHVLPRLAHWQRTRPDLMARARFVVDAAGYLVTWLTGRPVMDPATHHDHAVDGLPSTVPLPEIRPASSFAGGLTAAAASELGFQAGTPVTVGGYDSYVDLFGAGVRRDGEAGLLLGSTMVLGAVRHDAPDAAQLAVHGLRVTPYIGGTRFVGGWTSTSGSLIDWAEQLAPGEQAGRPLSAPGSHGLLVLPYFAGERAPVWDPFARGAILGPTLETTGAELRCAMREAVALSALDIADRLAAALGPVAAFRAAGGGLRNRAWAQDAVDALGIPIEAVAHAGEALGPAMLALAALGHDAEPSIAEVVRPDPRRHARYRELLDHYRRLYPALEDTLHALGRMAGKEEA